MVAHGGGCIIIIIKKKKVALNQLLDMLDYRTVFLVHYANLYVIYYGYSIVVKQGDADGVDINILKWDTHINKF